MYTYVLSFRASRIKHLESLGGFKERNNFTDGTFGRSRRSEKRTTKLKPEGRGKMKLLAITCLYAPETRDLNRGGGSRKFIGRSSGWNWCAGFNVERCHLIPLTTLTKKKYIYIFAPVPLFCVFLSLARPLLKAQVYAIVMLKIQRVWYALPQLCEQVHAEPVPAYLEIAFRRLFMRGLSLSQLQTRRMVFAPGSTMHFCKLLKHDARRTNDKWDTTTTHPTCPTFHRMNGTKMSARCPTYKRFCLFFFILLLCVATSVPALCTWINRNFLCERNGRIEMRKSFNITARKCLQIAYRLSLEISLKRLR